MTLESRRDCSILVMASDSPWDEMIANRFHGLILEVSDFATSAAPASSENDERCSLSVKPEGVLLAIADQKSRIENQPAPARVAKLADAPDLGFRNRRFHNVPFRFKKQAIYEGKMQFSV